MLFRIFVLVCTHSEEFVELKGVVDDLISQKARETLLKYVKGSFPFSTSVRNMEYRVPVCNKYRRTHIQDSIRFLC